LVGKIVFVLRGEIPFAEKAVSAQVRRSLLLRIFSTTSLWHDHIVDFSSDQRAGASALVVVDDGKCTKYDQQCLPGASKYLQEGFGAHDIKAHW